MIESRKEKPLWGEPERLVEKEMERYYCCGLGAVGVAGAGFGAGLGAVGVDEVVAFTG